jgi:hypothetical protein
MTCFFLLVLLAFPYSLKNLDLMLCEAYFGANHEVLELLQDSYLSMAACLGRFYLENTQLLA